MSTEPRNPEQTSLRRVFTVWLKRVFLAGKLPGVDLGSINDLQKVQSMLAERVTGDGDAAKDPRSVQFEITEQTREALLVWINQAHLRADDYLFPSRIHASAHLSTRQYAGIVEKWVTSSRLDRAAYRTHTMRRTKATLIYRRTKNFRTVQRLLGHFKLESAVHYLGIEVDDALEIAEQTEI